MKNAKRLISLLTVVCMIFTLFSTVTFAADYELTIDSVKSDIVIEGSAAVGRKFVVTGTLAGAAADEVVTVALFKGTTSPETKVVNAVKTNGEGVFTQTYIIPFGEENNGDYMVVANGPSAVAPVAAKFTMSAAKTTATITSLSVKNDREVLTATVDETNKTIDITDVPYKVNLGAIEVTVVSDATSVKIGDKVLPYVAEKKAFIGTVSCVDEVAQTITLSAEDPTAIVDTYTFTIDQIAAINTAELSDVMIAVYNEKTGNLRGFEAALSVDGDGQQTALVSLPGTFNLSKAYITFGTTAVDVIYTMSGESIVKFDESTTPTELDFSNDEKTVELMMEAENGDFHFCYITIETNSAEFASVELDVPGGPITATVNNAAKTITAKVPAKVGLEDLSVVYDAYGAEATVDGYSFASGDTLDFDTPKTLVLTDDKGIDYEYTMKVTVDPASVATLYSVKVAGKEATINQTTKQITVEVPATAKLTSLIFAYTVADGAELRVANSASAAGTVVASGTEYNFSAPKYLKVKSADGKTTYTYTLTVTQAEGAPSEGDTVTQKPDNNGKEDSFIVADKPTPPVITPIVTPPAPAITFTDLGTAEWAVESITNLVKKGVISGRSETIFDPDGLITREEYAKMLVLAFGLTAENATCDFADVPADAWYYEYVAIAAQRGIVNGMGNGSFGVGSTITRQDMAVMTYRAAMATGKAMDMANEAITFADNADIATYAAEAVTVMQRAGIINGMGGNTFAPTGTATRAQAAKIMDMASK